MPKTLLKCQGQLSVLPLPCYRSAQDANSPSLPLSLSQSLRCSFSRSQSRAFFLLPGQTLFLFSPLPSLIPLSYPCRLFGFGALQCWCQGFGMLVLSSFLPLSLSLSLSLPLSPSLSV